MAAIHHTLLVAGLGLGIPGSALIAQRPPRTLEPQVKKVELVLVSAGPVYGGGVRYVRVGAVPTHYRVGRTRDLSGVAWRPFTEGPVTTAINGGVKEFHGVFNPQSGPQIVPACAGGGFILETYLQFRFQVLHLNQALVSAVKGDSACVTP